MPQITDAHPDAAVLTIGQFCRKYAVGRDFVYSEHAAGRLPLIKAGGKTLIGKADDAAWFSACRVMGGQTNG